jgi:hypothetical protein
MYSSLWENVTALLYSIPFLEPLPRNPEAYFLIPFCLSLSLSGPATSNGLSFIIHCYIVAHSIRRFIDFLVASYPSGTYSPNRRISPSFVFPPLVAGLVKSILRLAWHLPETSALTMSHSRVLLDSCHAKVPGINTSYGYVPTLGAGIAYCTLFGISMLLHTAQFCWKRTWWCSVFSIGCLGTHDPSKSTDSWKPIYEQPETFADMVRCSRSYWLGRSNLVI